MSNSPLSRYAARGQMENLIKLHKVQLASDRMSYHSATANQVCARSSHRRVRADAWRARRDPAGQIRSPVASSRRSERPDQNRLKGEKPPTCRSYSLRIST